MNEEETPRQIQRKKRLAISALCKVSRPHGNATYLYIPKMFAKTYNLQPGDRVEVFFREHYWDEYVHGEDEEKPRDLRPKRGGSHKGWKE